MLREKLEKLKKEAARINGLSRSSYNLGNPNLGKKLREIHNNISKLATEIELSARPNGRLPASPQLTMEFKI